MGYTSQDLWMPGMGMLLRGKSLGKINEMCGYASMVKGFYGDENLWVVSMERRYFREVGGEI
jgi:hypothetical protein